MEKKAATNSPSKGPNSHHEVISENFNDGEVKQASTSTSTANEDGKPELHGKALRNKKKRDAKKAKKGGSGIEVQVSNLSMSDEPKQVVQTAPNESPGPAKKPDSGTCAHCQEEATSICLDCGGAVGSDETLPKTWYCGMECQKADHVIHKALCEKLQNRLQVYRSAKTAQAAWYAYRERLFDVSIRKVTKKGENITIYEGDYTPTQILAPFPHSLIPEKADKEAVLVYLTCEDAIANMRPLLEKLLEGCYTLIEEVDLRSKNHRRRTYFINAIGQRDEQEYNHLVLRVTTKGGEQFAFDITSAQYGYHDPVQPWDEFVALRVHEIKSVKPFGHFGSTWLRQQMATTDDIRGALYRTHDRASQIFHGCIVHYLEDANTTLPAAMKLPAERFWKIMTVVIDASGEAVQLWLDEERKTQRFL